MDIPGHKILYVLESGRRLPAPFPPYTSRIRAPYSRSRQTVIVAAMSSLVSPARALLHSAEGRSVFGARASPSRREGCPGDERSRGSPSHLLSAPPVVLGPALSNPGPGRNVGSAPRIQNPAPCCWYAPLPDLAAYWEGMGARSDAESTAGGRPRYVRGASCLLDVRGARRRFGPICRSGPGMYFPCTPDPFQAPRCPRVVQDQGKAWRITGQTTYLAQWRS